MTDSKQDETTRLSEALRLAQTTPGEEELAQAPVLEDWFLARAGNSTLVSGVTSHPHLGDSRIMTSLIVAMDADKGWVRSCSRLYRLGRQLRYDDPVIDQQAQVNGLRLDDIRKLSKRLNSNRALLEKTLRVLTH